MAWTLCKKDDVRSIHPISETDLQDLWSEAVEALIRRHLGEPYLGVSQALSELYSGDGSSVILLKHPPVIAVSLVTISDWIVPAEYYIVTPTSIQLLDELTFDDGNLNVSVDYTSGGGLTTDGIIDDPIIRLTAASMVVAIAQYKGRAGADASIKWGSADQKDGEPSPTFNAGLTSHLNTIMKRMLRRSHLRIS